MHVIYSLPFQHRSQNIINYQLKRQIGLLHEHNISEHEVQHKDKRRGSENWIDINELWDIEGMGDGHQYAD